MLLDSSGERPPKRARGGGGHRDGGNDKDSDDEQYYYPSRGLPSSSFAVTPDMTNPSFSSNTRRLTKRFAAFRLNQSPAG